MPDSTPASDRPVSFAEASSIVAAHALAILATRTEAATEQCRLDLALGRVLAAAIIADRDQPPFPRVTRDGFALRAGDLATEASFRLVAELRAGEFWPPDRPGVQRGEAVAIMTGAPLPSGADAVLMVEHAEQFSSGHGDSAHSSQSFIRPMANRRLAQGENVVARGSEARQGDVLIAPGTRLGPDEIALAASCGLTSVTIYPQSLVAVLATGDELVEAGNPDTPLGSIQTHQIYTHQIYDSNSSALVALVQQANAVPLRRKPARDEREQLAASIAQALDAAPLLLLTGGVSMGKYDLVEEVLAGMGAEFFFTGVRMQPGKPVVFGRVPAGTNRAERYFFGLPGNPVSTMVTFRLFVQPLLAAMTGERHWQPRIMLAQLAAEVQAKPGLTRFLPARLDTTQDVPLVTAAPTQGSGDLAANARANCYLIVPEDREILAAQQFVRVLLR